MGRLLVGPPGWFKPVSASDPSGDDHAAETSGE
jgi:hypothetical protein